MVNAKDIAIAKDFLGRVAAFTEVFSFKLFGSRARGGGSIDSDMDIFIVVPELTPELDKRISEAAWQTGLENDIVICTVVCTPEDLERAGFRGSPFLNAIAREGVAV